VQVVDQPADCPRVAQDDADLHVVGEGAAGEVGAAQQCDVPIGGYHLGVQAAAGGRGWLRSRLAVLAQ
jgi:hypothetical protein